MAGDRTVFGARAIAAVWRAIRQLNPSNVRAEAERGVRVALVGPVGWLQNAARFLLGENIEAYDKAGDTLILLPTPLQSPALGVLARCDVIICCRDQRDPLPGVAAERVFDLDSPDDLPEAVELIVQESSLAWARLPLARAFEGFRRAAAREIIQATSIENAVFVASTALGNVIPNPLQPFASVAEALGDIVVLTANQVRMMFRLGAAFDRQIGLRQQMPEAAAIVGAALGWRSIARELVSKLPFGSGIAPKAGIAFAGTWAIGDAISFYYATGRRLSKREIRERFEAAYDMGRATVDAIAARVCENRSMSRANPDDTNTQDQRQFP